MKKIYTLIQSLFLSFLLIGCLFSLPVNAGTIQIDSDIIGYGSIESEYDKSKVNGAGMMTILDYNGYGQTFAFCVQPDLSLPLANDPRYDYINDTSLTISNQVYVEWLLDSYADEVGSNASAGAALQLAIWEVMTDLDSTDDINDYDLDYVVWDSSWNANNYSGSGKFSYLRSIDNINIDAWYDYYITGLVTAMDADQSHLYNYQRTGNYFIADLKDANGQDIQNIIIEVVPEPSTALLFALGLLGFGVMGRKKPKSPL